MEPLRYTDTRGRDPQRPAFMEAVLTGIAEGGGLYVPERLPHLALEDILALGDVPYHARAARVFEAFGVDIPRDHLEHLFARAYGEAFDHPAVAPVSSPAPGIHLLELWHGPTAAFKDMALQVLPLLFAEARSRADIGGSGRPGRPGRHLILVATSGDTGKAALEGFAGAEGTAIVVFYPADGVSELQRLQMVTQQGENLSVFGVRGNFDDCQTAVKAAFADEAFNRRLREEFDVALSSANSINWGRLLPQVVYYLSAYADLVARGAVAPGQAIDVCVPTGNFGNILAGYYARRVGVPLARLLCASNENRVLADFLETGSYDVRDRQFVTTPSPSMDILISSNLERALYEICRDPALVSEWMARLRSEGRFTVDEETRASLHRVFRGGWVSNPECLDTVREVHDETGLLLDPHTAVAWRLAERLQESRPMLVVGTAHWAKFGLDVYRALTGIPPGAPLPPNIAALSPGELLQAVVQLAPNASVPASLAELEELPRRFDRIVEGSPQAVADAVESFLRGDGQGSW